MAQSRLADAASGMVAGTAGVLIGHPIDTVRVNVIVRGMRPSEAASRILREAGVRGLFRGVLPPLLTNGLVGTTVFSAFEAAKRALRPHVERGVLPESVALGLAGASAGAVVSVVSTPPQVLKVQLQTTAGVAGAASMGGGFSATTTALRALVQARGLGGLYTGFRAQLLCESLGRMTYYFTYEAAKRGLVALRGGATSTARPMDPVAGVTLPERMLAGACAGCVGWTITFPFDVARNRLQCQLPGEPARYRGVWDCLATSVRAEGWPVLYRGLGITLVRAAPVAMTVLPVFDLVRDAVRSEFGV